MSKFVSPWTFCVEMETILFLSPWYLHTWPDQLFLESIKKYVYITLYFVIYVDLFPPGEYLKNTWYARIILR